jgi:hypothetical protein
MAQAYSINPAVSQTGATTALHRGQEEASTPDWENMPPENLPPHVASVSASQPVSPPDLKRSRREIYGPRWLLRLSSLPAHLYRETVDRLVRGDSVYNVSHWLAARRDRGRLQDLNQETLRKYLYQLAEEVKRQKRAHPPASRAEVKAAPDYLPTLDQLASPQLLPRRRGQAYQSIGSFLCDRVERQNKLEWLWGLIGHYYEQLERCRMVEEDYHHRKELPTQAMCAARAQIGNILLGLFAELRELDLVDLEREKLELMRRKAALALGEFDEFDGLDGNRLNPESQLPLATPRAPGSPPPQPPASNPYDGLNATDLLFARSFTEKLVAACNLQKTNQ